ncbi:MAG: hypothetical protein AAGF57_16410 [Pseudomonadota bacterium]
MGSVKAFGKLLALVLSTSLSVSSSADDPPSLLGEWRTEQSIFSENAKGKPRFSENVTTSTIDVQNGRRFAGVTFKSAANRETNVGNNRFVGMISADNASLYMVNGGGFIDCRIMSAQHLDCQYRNPAAHKNATAIMSWRRTPP